MSSLTHEIYKGDNIRAIVDRMLDSYPMLLPQKKMGAKLLLHPTAAISAFLAAAFILNIDGVRARDITEVLVAAGRSVSKGAEDLTDPAEPIPHDGLLRGDALKTMFSELNSAAYNVAVLGVVLIVHELGVAETGLEEETAGHFLMNSMGLEGREVGKDDDKATLNYEHAELIDNTPDVTTPTKTSVLNNLRKNNGEIDEDKKEQKAASNQGYDGKFTLGDKQNKEGPKLTDGIDGRWGNLDVQAIEKKSPGAVVPTESLVLQPPWVVAMLDSGLSEEEHLLNKGINHTPAVQDLSEIEAGIGLLGEEAVLLLEPLGVPTIATIEPFKFVSDVDTSLDTLVTVLDDTALALNPMFESLPTETLVSVSEPEIEKTVSLPELNAQQPVAILVIPLSKLVTVCISLVQLMLYFIKAAMQKSQVSTWEQTYCGSFYLMKNLDRRKVVLPKLGIYYLTLAK